MLALTSALLTAATFAADPTGTWKWSTPGRDGQAFESTLKLELKDGKLSGTMVGIQRDQFQIPDTPIGDASFKGDVVAFTVTREFNGNKFTSKYEGKLEGDTIKGTSERPGRDGGTTKRDWVAKRAK
ncbi:MAG: hypothetical protein HZC55_08545 [Verrucomicrobia bacterium]|nr:hypothetical protein [Verrucomicrobiota bacterium]